MLKEDYKIQCLYTTSTTTMVAINDKRLPSFQLMVCVFLHFAKLLFANEAEEIIGDHREDIEFLLWTRSNALDHQTFVFNDNFTIQDLHASNFNSKQETKVMIHGFRAFGTKHFLRHMRDALLETVDVNVISVDWSRVDEGRINNFLYWKAVKNCELIGSHVADFLAFLDQAYDSFSLESTHIIGHSLGAHIAGFVGKHLDGGIGRVTGLDPAKPFISASNATQRLDSTDANFVDVIHTSGGIIAMETPIGDADFYPNGGVSPQPGCPWFGQCSHKRSYKFFIESIRSPAAFPATACDSWDSFVESICNENRVVHMGYRVPNGTWGVFYLHTNSDAPYGVSTRSHPNETTIETNGTSSLFSRLFGFLQ